MIWIYLWKPNKIQTIEKLFYYIVASSYLFILLGFIISKNKKRDTVPLSLLIYGLLFITLLLSYDSLEKDSKKIFQPAYTYIEYVFFTFFIWSNLVNKRFKQLVLIFSVLFFVFQIFYYFKSKLIRLDSVPIAIETILLFIYIVFFFYEFSKKIRSFYIYNHYCFWIAVGILVYLGGSFFFYLSINELNPQEVDTFGKLTYLAEIIKNILFAISLFVYSKNPILSKKDEKPVNIPYLDMI
jgi:hypothetical protein